MNTYLNNKTILITGGTGSLGNQLVQTISEHFTPKKVIIFSRDECKQHHMAAKFKSLPWLRFLIGDVRDADRITWCCRKVDCVVHAAAMKQIGTCEYAPVEAIKTNIMGSTNVMESCLSNNVKRAVLVSTDKACAPINLYGTTKLAAERLFLAANSYNNTQFRVVRYGNVLNSRGSVVELFLKLKAEGVKEFPITDEKMTRFWFTLAQAAQTVLTAMTVSDDIPPALIPKLPSMKITDLARAIDPECTFKIIGRQKGEKLHESLTEGYSSDTNGWWLTADDVRKMLGIEE